MKNNKLNLPPNKEVDPLDLLVLQMQEDLILLALDEPDLSDLGTEIDLPPLTDFDLGLEYPPLDDDFKIKRSRSEKEE